MRCPVCKKPTVERYAPFCSKRCADVDLGRWLQGDYILPGDAPLEGIAPDNDEDQGV